jgi:hypothetical protein
MYIKHILAINASNTGAREALEQIEGSSFTCKDKKTFIQGFEADNGFVEESNYLYTLEEFTTMFNDEDEDCDSLADLTLNYYITFVDIEFD